MPRPYLYNTLNMSNKQPNDTPPHKAICLAQRHTLRISHKPSLVHIVCLWERFSWRSLADSTAHRQRYMHCTGHGSMPCKVEHHRKKHFREVTGKCHRHLHTLAHRHAFCIVDGIRHCTHTHLLWHSDDTPCGVPSLLLPDMRLGVIDVGLVVDNHSHHRHSTHRHRTGIGI